MVDLSEADRGIICVRVSDYGRRYQAVSVYHGRPAASKINSYGGYSTFDEATDGKNLLYCLVIPKGERPLSREDMFPCNSDKFVYGWISPAGDTYLCDYEEHMDAAEMIYEEQYKKPCMSKRKALKSDFTNMHLNK